jgi:hypothetical protein
MQDLSKFQKLFSGKFGHYPHMKRHLDLQDNAVPPHKRAYRAQVQHGRHGVLERTGRSEWASPTFVIPKKDG